jgi:hypothetical protein
VLQVPSSVTGGVLDAYNVTLPNLMRPERERPNIRVVEVMTDVAHWSKTPL